MTEQHGNCVFCRICNTKEQTEILYEVSHNLYYNSIQYVAVFQNSVLHEFANSH